MAADAGNFYLATPFDRQEYMQIEAKLLLQAFIDANNLASKYYCTFVLSRWP